jgi:NADH-quinone oxidoreductase subunit J
MELVFYTASVIAVLSALRVITGTNPVHALLYMVVTLLAIAATFFALGAAFAGILEVIVYAGAIVVLFVFVVMMLNLGAETIERERRWLRPGIWIGPAILCTALLIELLIVLPREPDAMLGTQTVSAKAVGIALYGPYLLAVELASMLLLGGLVVAYHLGRQEEG